MNVSRNIGFVAVATVAAVAAVGCGKKDNAAEAPKDAAPVAAEAAAADVAEEAAEETAEEAVNFADDEKLVEAYGKSLTYGEAVSNVRRAMKMQGVPDDQLDAAVKQVAPMALPQIVEEFVMMSALQDAAAKGNVVCSDEDIEAEFAKATSSLPPGVTLEEALERSGLSVDELKKQMRDMLPIRKMMEILTQGIEVAEDEVAKFYEENAKSFETPEQVRASHILVKLEADASDEDKAAAKEKIEGLLAQIKEGADFAELATANSDCPSKDKGGDLGFFGKGQMVAPFEVAAFALADGEISGIVETPFGFHIIKKTGSKEAGKTPLEEVKDRIKGFLENEKKGKIVDDYMKGVRADLVYTANEKLGPIFVQPEEPEEAPAEAAPAALETPAAEVPAAPETSAAPEAPAVPEAPAPAAAPAAPETPAPAE